MDRASMIPPGLAAHPRNGPPQDTQPPPPRTPDFVADHLIVGLITDSEGREAITCGFVDGAGNTCNVVLTNYAGAVTEDLAEQFTRAVKRVMPPPVDVVNCDRCGRRIFGDVAKTGTCMDCAKTVGDQGTPAASLSAAEGEDRGDIPASSPVAHDPRTWESTVFGDG